MSTNSLYPVFLNLAGRNVVVIGGGKVALRKTRVLVRAGAVVTVVAPRFARGFEKLPVGRVDQPYRPSHLRGAAVAFAASDDRAVNASVMNVCRAKGILVNVCDDAAGCDFHVPAALRDGSVAVAVSTNGAAPAVGARLKREIRALLAAGWAQRAEEAGRKRADLRARGVPPARRRRILRDFAGGGKNPR
jgi:siroheme synthase-like protein